MNQADASQAHIGTSFEEWLNIQSGPLLLFFDSFSPEAFSLLSELENKFTGAGKALPTTPTAVGASHIVVDASNNHPWTQQLRRVSRARGLGILLVEHGRNVREDRDEVDSRELGTRNRAGVKIEEREMEDEEMDSDESLGEEKDSGDEDYEEEKSLRSASSSHGRVNVSKGTPWTTSEKKSLVQLFLAMEGAPLAKVSETYGVLNSDRSASGTTQQYCGNREWYDKQVKIAKRELEKLLVPSSTSTSTSNSRHQPPPSQPRLHQPSPSFPSGLSTSSSPTSTTSPSKPSGHLPFNPTKATASTHNNIETDQFLSIGSKPSSCSPSDPFCYFCGSTDTSKFTTVQPLVGWKEIEGQKIYDAMTERRGCKGCYSFFRKKINGEGVPESVKIVGEQHRLAWITDEVLKRGIRIRREVVEEGDGRTEG